MSRGHNTFIVSPARRLEALPPYLFVQIDALKDKMMRRGVDVIDMGIGDPDQPTPRFIRQALLKALNDSRNHRYPTNWGLKTFRLAIAEWYKKRFGVVLDPEKEILPLIGSKEGIGHLPLAFVNPGERVLVPDPGYPPYRTGTILASGRPVAVPLLESNAFLPDLGGLKKKAKGAKLMFLNYPNNPTAAVADLSFFKELVSFSLRTGVAICHDAAYSEITFGGLKHPSFLQVPGAKEVGIEFHSLSKTFNMTGWRIGWVCGNSKMVSALAKVKSNIDSGIFQAIQAAGTRALQDSGNHLAQMIRLYEERQNLLVKVLREGGWKVRLHRATFYVWVALPKGCPSRKAASDLLEKTGIVATPGVGFGEHGEGYIRFSLSVPTPRLQEAARRLLRFSE